MKIKLLIIILGVSVFAGLPLQAQAAEMNFPAGSLIIPMDSFYQEEDDGGILEAYGLVFYLLKHKTDGEHDITVYWIINQEKVAIDSNDFIIEDLTLTTGSAVAKLYDHDDTISDITFNTGDSFQKITYSSAPFVIDEANADLAKAIINQSQWSAVEVHEAQVPFAAPVHREMHGTPPRIAVMNDDEDREGGNAEILESYLRLAGICTDVYDVVTPCDIRGDVLTTGDGYDFLWSPHWTGYDKYDNDDDNCSADGDSVAEVEEIVLKIKEFLEGGKGVLAECASIEVFEHSPNGRFLSTKGFAHNGGSNSAQHIVYNDIHSANSQVGDFEYDPEGGHLHNWRPFQFGDDGDFNFDDSPSDTGEVTSGNNSAYEDTVTRFTIDDTGWDYYVGGYAYGDTNNGYVIYLGGHKYAECKGQGGETDPDPNEHEMEVEFTKDIETDSDKEHFTLLVEYDSGSETRITFDAADMDDFDTLTVSTFEIGGTRYQWTVSPADAGGNEYYLELAGGGDPMISEPADVKAGGTTLIFKTGELGTLIDDSWQWGDIDSLGFDTIYVQLAGGADPDTETMTADFPIVTGDPLEIDLSEVERDDKKIKDMYFRNIGSSTITIDSLTWYWTGGHNDQKFKKFKDKFTDDKIYDEPKITSGVTPAVDDFISVDIAPSPAAAVDATAGCTDNSDCSWKNIAGVRYVLNTLFNIKFQIQSHEYVRSAPIVSHPCVYQGTFEYPSYEGHFRRFSATTDDYAPENADWDTAAGGVLGADSRAIYTAEQTVYGDWAKVAFTTAQMAKLRSLLDVTPSNGDDTDEEAVIHRVRGKYWNPDSGTSGEWLDRSNRLGPIEHSAPVIVDSSSRTGTRAEMAYVGDLYGMFHAIATADGSEQWVYIPRQVLDKLKNDRTDENAPQDFAGVDGSPTAVDVYYDPPNISGTAKSWRTILANTGGKGGNYLFALDITDPTDWSVLWEYTSGIILNYTGTSLGYGVGDTVTGATSGATGVVVADDTANGDLTIQATSGTFEAGENISDGAVAVAVNKIVEMGNASRLSLSKVKWPVRDTDDVDSDGDTDEIIGYEQKHVIFVSTGFVSFAEQHGGINVFAVDLQTGERLWHFSEEYADSINDIPGAVTVYDMDGDNLSDRVFVGDMNGRMWELDAETGANPHGTETVGGVVKQIPLYNAGVGNPISVSPSIIKQRNSVVVVFGTGGADWAADDSNYSLYAVDAANPSSSPTYAGGGGTLKWATALPTGEKVWSTPTIFENRVYLATSTGTMESLDPGDDVASGTGKLRTFYLNSGAQDGDATDTGKARGSIYVSRGQLYLTTLDNTITRVGDGDFSFSTIAGAVLKAWRQLFD